MESLSKTTLGCGVELGGSEEDTWWMICSRTVTDCYGFLREVAKKTILESQKQELRGHYDIQHVSTMRVRNADRNWDSGLSGCSCGYSNFQCNKQKQCQKETLMSWSGETVGVCTLWNTMYMVCWSLLYFSHFCFWAISHQPGAIPNSFKFFGDCTGPNPKSIKKCLCKGLPPELDIHLRMRPERFGHKSNDFKT